MKRTILLVALCLVLATGCTTVSTQNRPPDYYNQSSASSSSLSSDSLSSIFNTNESALSSDELDQIISSRIELPDMNRIAIIPITSDTWNRKFKPDFSFLDSDIEKGFVSILRSSDKVYDASFLPRLIAPAGGDISELRKAAARYQADLILLYHPDFELFSNLGLFVQKKEKVHLVLEAVMLDTRTGMVLFTSISLKESEVVRDKDEDVSRSEAAYKSKKDVVASALEEVAAELVEFMDNMP
jgi:hypothetical protein